MKAKVMKEAWKIYRKMLNKNFSIALKASWCKHKYNTNKVIVSNCVVLPLITKGKEIFAKRIVSRGGWGKELMMSLLLNDTHDPDRLEDEYYIMSDFFKHI